MIIQTCPYTSSSKATSLFQEALGVKNMVAIHRCCQDAISEHAAPLSLKFTLKGNETYLCDQQTLQVDAYNYLILNKDQSYSSYINSKEQAVSFCVFFSDAFVSDIIYSRSKNNIGLLDPADGEVAKSLFFHQKLHYKDQRITQLLQQFQLHFQAGHLEQQLAVDAWCYNLADVLWLQYTSQQQQLDNVMAAKPATRIELHKRLSRAVDYMHAAYHLPVSLQELSKVACLSLYHFHRAFKEVFRTTPYAFLTKLRLAHAISLLAETSLPVNEVCQACGFENESSFIRLFKRSFHLTPLAFRQTQKERLHSLPFYITACDQEKMIS